MALKVEAIDHVVLNVIDPEASAKWYEEVLGMTRQETRQGPDKPPRLSVKFGAQKINLRPISATQESWFTAVNATAGSDDLCFLTQSTPETVAAHLEALDVPIEQGPVEKSGAHGKLVSVYCRDPDGNLVEVSSYVVEKP